jgi:hypothetical protein
MSSLPWVVIVGVILLVTLVLFAVSSDKNKKNMPNYFTLFIMGAFWVMIGVFADVLPLWVMGLIYVFVGISHKDKWEENNKKWRKMTESDRNFNLLMAGTFGTLFLIGLVVLYLTRLAQ